MKRISLLLLIAAAPLLAQAPGDARRGGAVLREGQCLDCHSFQGSGAGTAPDLGHRAAEVYTRTQVTALMWNHAPGMWDAMRKAGKTIPALSVESVGDLFAYLYAARFFEPTGDAGRGKAVFQQRRCATCHDLHATKVGPPVAEWKSVSDPALWIRQMWNHSGAMYKEAEARKIAWPNLTGQDLSDLLVYFKSIPELRSSQARFALSDPAQGKALFDTKGCTGCHVVKGQAEGKISIPVNGRPTDSLATVAAAMWNHAPIMNAAAKGNLPHFEADEMNHVLAYLFWAGFFDDPGDPRAGQRVYEKKQCGSCHDKAVDGAPDLKAMSGANSLQMTSSLWRHGPKMLAALKQRGVEWPRFSGSEMADLIAFLNHR